MTSNRSFLVETDHFRSETVNFQVKTDHFKNKNDHFRFKIDHFQPLSSRSSLKGQKFIFKIRVFLQ